MFRYLLATLVRDKIQPSHIDASATYAFGAITVGGAPVASVVRRVGASLTPDAADTWLGVDATSAPVVVTLPAAASSENRVLTVKRISGGANAVTVAPSGLDQIDGGGAVVLTEQHEAVTVACDGIAWMLA